MLAPIFSAFVTVHPPDRLAERVAGAKNRHRASASERDSRDAHSRPGETILRAAARGTLIAVIGSREITAGIEPARRNGTVATLTVGLGHDVSTVLGIGRQRGSQARASGVAVSGERFSQAANRLQLEMWLR